MKKGTRVKKGDKVEIVNQESAMYGRIGEVLEVIEKRFGTTQVLVEFEGLLGIYNFCESEVKVISENLRTKEVREVSCDDVTIGDVTELAEKGGEAPVDADKRVIIVTPPPPPCLTYVVGPDGEPIFKDRFERMGLDDKITLSEEFSDRPRDQWGNW